MSTLKLAFILEAIDKATQPLRRVGKEIDQINEPAKRVSRSMDQVSYRFGRLMGNRLGRQWGEVTERGAKLSQTAQGVAQTFGAVTLAAGGAFYAMKRTVDEIDRANDVSKKLGMAVEQYQRMGYAAQLNGSNQEEMGQALQFLSQNMVEAINGSKEAAQWFARVGIPLDKLKKMNAGQVFEAIADKFKAVGDAGQNSEKKIAVMRALMGRGGAELKQVLDLGSDGLKRFYEEADRMGAVVGGDTADSMADFNDNFDRMKFSIFGVMASITKAALPALDGLVKKFTELNVTNRAEWGEKLGGIISKIVDALPGFLKSLGQITGAMVVMAGAADMFAQMLGGWQNVIYLVGGLLAAKLAIGIFSVGSAIVALIPTLWSLGAVLLATPLGWFLGAIALIAGAIYLIYRNWEPIKAFFSNLWDGVKATFMAVYTFIAEKLGAILGFAGKVIDTVKNAFSMGGSTGATEFDALGNSTGYSAGTAFPAGSAAKASFDGTLKIQIDSEGRARVAEAKSSNPDLDMEVYGGQAMAM